MRTIFTGNWGWWQIVSQNEIETGDAGWGGDYSAAFDAADGTAEDPESWVARVTAVADRHRAIRVGDYVVCGDGIGGDVKFVRPTHPTGCSCGSTDCPEWQSMQSRRAT